MMRVLVACEFSGRVRDAFIALGHDAKAFNEEGKRYARCGFPIIATRYRRMARDAAASAAEFVAMRTTGDGGADSWCEFLGDRACRLFAGTKRNPPVVRRASDQEHRQERRK